MNWHAVRAIYRFEMARTFRTVVQSILTPVLTTSLYFVVFGSAIGSRITEIDGVPFAAFIVPGLIMLSVLTESIGNASFGIYFPKWSGTIYELLSAPVSTPEILLGYVGAAATKSMMIGLIILATSAFFVPLQMLHPFWMLMFLLLTALTFSLFGFVLGIWATSWEKLQFVPSLVVTPLTFLGGSFYSIDMLPRRLAHDQPVQPGGVPDQRLSLELLRQVRRQRADQPRPGAGHHGGLLRGDFLDDPQRLAPEALKLRDRDWDANDARHLFPGSLPGSTALCCWPGWT